MNGESTYEPNFVIHEEDKTTTEQREYEDNLKPTTQATAVKGEVSNKLINREVEFIEAQRNKLRLFDPKGVYFYRHIAISYFQSGLHAISLLVSCYLIYLFMLEIGAANKAFVDGIGWVSDKTLLEKLANVICIGLFFTQLRGLFKLKKSDGGNRYKLAMLANAINLIVINHLKVLILLVVTVMLYAFSLSDVLSPNMILETLSNGVLSDVSDALLSLITIIIFVRALRFCKKELK